LREIEAAMSARNVNDTRQDASACDLDLLWAHYANGREIGVRNALAGRYAEFARMMAAQAYGRRTSQDVEFDDYLQYARLGLIESIERYDPSRGAKFETYAAIRISGAILNGLESASELHEQLAASRRRVAERTAALRAASTAGSGGDVFDRLAEIAIGLAVGFMLEGSGMFREDEQGTVPDNTYNGIELRQMRRRLHDTIAQLPERQRHVVQAHYVQNQPFDEIAAGLKLSRGRVSQLHKEALSTLAALLATGQDVDFSF
jgi:RNA polymerase sigma factor for flagellar operon FliA